MHYLATGTAWVLGKLLWSMKFSGTENIPPNGAFPYIIASNHQAYFDPAWIAAKIRQKIAFMAWGEAFEWKYVGAIIRYLGSFPVHLGGGAKSLASIKTALRILKAGGVLAIFPEGERAFEDAKLLEFKEGVASIAMRAQVPIMPVTIKGGNRVWAQGMPRPRFFRHVEIVYHPLIQPPAKDEDGGETRLTTQIHDVIASAL